MTNYLFVYGTLLKGESNNSRLKNSILVEYGSVPGKLYDTTKGYPVAYYNSKLKSRIYGEIYQLPENHKALMTSLDDYEVISNNIYVRNEIVLKNKRTFIYTARDSYSVKNLKEIHSGSWLKYSPAIKKNPLTFAKNFEYAHKNYYRNSKIKSTICIPGNSKILVSAPHATNHVRLSKLKRFEIYTATISVLLHSYLDITAIYSNSVTDPDPNYYDESKYKKILKDCSCKEDLNFILDLHGTDEKREADIYPGVGKNKEFLIGNEYILDEFYNSAEKYSIKCGSLNKFTASKQNTVTKFCANRLTIPSMQLEINKTYRQPEKYPDRFEALIKFLISFLSQIKKRNE